MRRATQGGIVIQTKTPRTAAQQSANEIFARAKEERVEIQKVRAEQAKAGSKVSRERATTIALAVSAPFLVALVVFNVVGLSVSSMFETPPTPAAARQEVQRTLDTFVADIEAFRKQYNELPESIVEIGTPGRGTWSYVVSGSTYRIQGSLYGQNVSFNSATAPQNTKQ